MICYECDWVLILISLVTGLYLWGRWLEGHFERNGVKSIKQETIPLVENLGKALLGKEHFMDTFSRLYNSFPDQKYVGILQLSKRKVMIRDLDLIKQVTVKDFDYFQDHVGFFDNNNDPLFGKALISLGGQKWRDMRPILSPAFTSSKMRSMFTIVEECGQNLADYFVDQANQQEGEILEVEMKDAFRRYSNDVIATSAFGVQVNSLRDQDNEFFNMGLKATVFTGKTFIKFFVMTILPKVSKFFNLTLIPMDAINFFRRTIKDNMKQREEQGTVRPDMIQLLMEAKKGALRHDAKEEAKDAGFATVEESALGKRSVVKREWSDDELTAQAFIFFFAGFNSASSAMSFTAHELAVNTDVQERLRMEVDEVMERSGGKPDYNTLHSMKYLDMVISESLRKWPPTAGIDRKCVKPYTLPPPSTSSDKGYKMNVGDGLVIYTWGIHRNPQYFPDPEKFNPERFSDENKHLIHPFSFLPFGCGPRSCIGSRFALMEVKAAMVFLLARFELLVIEKTILPVVLKKRSATLMKEGGFWIGLKKRQP